MAKSLNDDLMELAAYSRQLLRVDNQPIPYIYDEFNELTNLTMLRLSVELRQAQALERIAEAQERQADAQQKQMEASIEYTAVGPVGHKFFLAKEADGITVSMVLECPTEADADVMLEALKTKMEPLFDQPLTQKGGQGNG